MLRTTKIIAAAAVMSWASVASASEEHTILVLPDAFFPELTYVKAGDRIRFVDEQSGASNIVSKNEEWEVGPLGADGENVLTVAGGMETVFYAASSQEEGSDLSVKGAISFDPPPNN